MRTHSNQPYKIAVAAYRFIGDTLLATPFLSALRSQYPQAVIHLLTGPLEQPLMAGCPYIDAATAFDPRKAGMLASIKQLRQEKYDSIYLLKRSFSSALIAFLAGIPQRIGFNTESRGFLLTQKVPYQPEQFHEAECFLKLLPTTIGEPPHPPLLRLIPFVSCFATTTGDFSHEGRGNHRLSRCGTKIATDTNHHTVVPSPLAGEGRVRGTSISADTTYLENWLTQAQKDAAALQLQAIEHPRIVLHATSTNMNKCWPMNHFTQLAKRLIEIYKAQLIFFGSPAEHCAYDELITNLTSVEQSHIYNMAGQTTLVESLALLTQVDLVVANDCGMIHMAAAADTPVVALFGPTRPRQWRPLARRVTILEAPNGNLAELSVQDVLSACQPYLNPTY